MSKLSPETVEQVKEAADIVEIVSAHTDLRRAGARFSGLCPFHDERTPSFSVDPQEKLYYCFGCEAGGDVFRFLQEKEGLSFPDAVESLAERYGVAVEREAEDPRAEAVRRRKARLGELLERTSAFYATFLRESPKAGRAREYLAGRGLSEDVLGDFGVGFAPSAWDQVLTRGQRAGYSVDEMHAAGLVQKGNRGPYDRFRARITFPLRDVRGRVVGFGARALGADSKPKYLNSPEGELFHKGRMLYGLDRARGPIAKANRVVVVEGYTDVLALHQAGVGEAVAVMGTAITPDQLGLLSGLCEVVVLALDADRAGQEAMIRAQKVAAGRELSLRVAKMPEDADPADMLQKGELGRFQQLVERAVDLPAFQVETALSRAEGSASGREKTLSEVAPVLFAMGETVGRDELIRRVASGLDTEPSLVARRVEAGAAVVEAAAATGSDAGKQPARPPRTEVAPSPRELRERALLAMCISEPGPGRDILGRLEKADLSSQLGGRAVAWLAEHLEDPMAGLPREDEELVSLITQLVMSAKREPASAEAMELNLLLLQQRALEDRISAAREQEDYASAQQLSAERSELVTKIAGSEHT
ncbi:MAG: DNA primase [Solirubrobacterales bacterium]